MARRAPILVFIRVDRWLLPAHLAIQTLEEYRQRTRR